MEIYRPQRRWKMTSPEPHVYLCARHHPCAACLIPLEKCTPGGRRESRERKVVERVGVGCIVLVLMKGSGPSVYPRDCATPPVPPKCQQPMRIFTPLELVISVSLHFREKFLSEVFRGWNLTPPCCRRQETEPECPEAPEARVYKGTLGEELEHPSLWLSL